MKMLIATRIAVRRGRFYRLDDEHRRHVRIPKARAVAILAALEGYRVRWGSFLKIAGPARSVGPAKGVS